MMKVFLMNFCLSKQNLLAMFDGNSLPLFLQIKLTDVFDVM